MYVGAEPVFTGSALSFLPDMFPNKFIQLYQYSWHEGQDKNHRGLCAGQCIHGKERAQSRNKQDETEQCSANKESGDTGRVIFKTNPEDAFAAAAVKTMEKPCGGQC